MDHPSIIVCAPLPSATEEQLREWHAAFEAALAPLLDARQREHVRRFGRENQPGDRTAARGAGLSRLLARALLAVHAAEYMTGYAARPGEGQSPGHRFMRGAGQKPSHGAKPPTLPGPLRMDDLGRPLLDGWQAAFCHSGPAAFCALQRIPRTADDAWGSGGDNPGEPAPVPQPVPHATARLTTRMVPHIALDAEALSSPPPAARAFAPDEADMPLPQPFAAREALRRWTIKEALLKAAGLGLSMDPALVPSGGFGRRSGLWRGPCGLMRWRLIPCPGHWLCLARPGDERDDPPLLVWHGARDMACLLARLRSIRLRA